MKGFLRSKLIIGSLLSNRTNRMSTMMQALLRGLRNLFSSLHPLSLPELLWQLEEATTPHQLTRVVNRLQYLLWKLPAHEQTRWRKKMIYALKSHVLEGTQKVLRIEAAGWLRLFLQAGLVSQPEDIFVTLVTAATHAQGKENATDPDERKAYLTLIGECLWSFHYPYPTFSWQMFPSNQVFYPLAPLFNQADDGMQDTLIGIFAELHSLDDCEISDYLLPVALCWASHADPERRRRVTHVLARIAQTVSQEALHHLLNDADPLVRASAHSAAGFVRRA